MKKTTSRTRRFHFFLNLRKHLVEVVRHTICYLKTKKHWSSRNPLGWAKIIRIHDQVSVSKQIYNLSVEFPFYFLVQKWVFPWQLQCSFLSRLNFPDWRIFGSFHKIAYHVCWTIWTHFSFWYSRHKHELLRKVYLPDLGILKSVFYAWTLRRSFRWALGSCARGVLRFCRQVQCMGGGGRLEGVGGW